MKNLSSILNICPSEKSALPEKLAPPLAFSEKAVPSHHLENPLWNSLIIHEENTKEIMTCIKEFVYLIQNHADLYKLYVFSLNIIHLFIT
jgi:hypothetical protein